MGIDIETIRAFSEINERPYSTANHSTAPDIRVLFGYPLTLGILGGISSAALFPELAPTTDAVTRDLAFQVQMLGMTVAGFGLGYIRMKDLQDQAKMLNLITVYKNLHHK